MTRVLVPFSDLASGERAVARIIARRQIDLGLGEPVADRRHHGREGDDRLGYSDAFNVHNMNLQLTVGYTFGGE